MFPLGLQLRGARGGGRSQSVDATPRSRIYRHIRGPVGALKLLCEGEKNTFSFHYTVIMVGGTLERHNETHTTRLDTFTYCQTENGDGTLPRKDENI